MDEPTIKDIDRLFSLEAEITALRERLAAEIAAVSKLRAELQDDVVRDEEVQA